MKRFNFCLLLILIFIANAKAEVFHKKMPIEEEWKEEILNPFDELMFSWNAARPPEGAFHFYIRVKTDEWSPWLLYATWGADGQSGFLSTCKEATVRVYQVVFKIMEDKKANAFHIKIVPEGNTNISNIHGLHVYLNSDDSDQTSKADSSLSSIYLDVCGISQMSLNHNRYADLCSPTSTTAVTKFLIKDNTIDPLHFAENSWDSGFDIFGNWTLNIAQASTLLGDKWDCWVERLHEFNEIHNRLLEGTPVIVSVRGPLSGSALSYSKGHLLVVIGYDSMNRKVFCMDPAFPSDEETLTSYNLDDFTQAWNRRGNISYVFAKK